MADRHSIIRDLTGFTERQVRRVALLATSNLIDTTPVDTGWARSNWVPSAGAPVVGPFGNKTQLDASTQQLGQARVAAYKLSDGDVFISNGVPYIQKLNAGSSKQAPAMFVEAAIDDAIRSVRARN